MMTGDGRGRRPRPGQVELPLGAHLVDEGGLTFEVNFTDRLDCGIFLDHRETRSMVRELMKQTMGSKRFLNLFAYTGTATCYAADGGAKYTTTVDMSRPSLEWARRNMARNGFDSSDNEFVQADVLRWVDEQRRTKNRWDLIFCDVPTFSNSNRMRDGSWDVQRDHAELIIGISRLLTRNGCALFSCNLRSFEPDMEKLERTGVRIEDITAQTIPEDFSRNPKVHHTFRVTRTPLPEGAMKKDGPRGGPRFRPAGTDIRVAVGMAGQVDPGTVAKVRRIWAYKPAQRFQAAEWWQDLREVATPTHRVTVPRVRRVAATPTHRAAVPDRRAGNRPAATPTHRVAVPDRRERPLTSAGRGRPSRPMG